ncbi:MAG: TetR/AcrR family transcriptional regulator [Bryobacterales bacterium]|nr:TetR/AcrR family transcriptional regulator [Bryobacterales bacterium]
MAIVEAATELFAAKGFRGTTTRELANAVGVTEPVLYQHFKTKNDLYNALLESKSHRGPSAASEVLAPFIEARDDRGFFTQLGLGILAWHLDDPRFCRLLMFSSLERHELSELFYENHVLPFYEVITGYLNLRMEQGAFRKMDPLVAARSFAGIFAHLGIIHSIYCPHGPVLDREAVTGQMVDIYLRGIQVPGS